MKKLGVFFVLLSIACEGPKEPNFDLVVENVNLVDVVNKRLVPNTNIYIKSGKIAKIDSGMVESNISKKLDGTNRFLIPGLFDCHVHTSNYERDFPKFVHFGVTSIFVTGGNGCTNEYFKAMRIRGEQDSIPAPNVFHTSQHFIRRGGHPVRTYPGGDWREGKTVFYLKGHLAD